MTKTHKIIAGVVALILISLTAVFALNNNSRAPSTTKVPTGGRGLACSCCNHHGLKEAYARAMAEEKVAGGCSKEAACLCGEDCGCCDACKAGGICDCENCKCDQCGKKAACCCGDDCKCCEGCKGGTCTCEDCKCCDGCKKAACLCGEDCGCCDACKAGGICDCENCKCDQCGKKAACCCGDDCKCCEGCKGGTCTCEDCKCCDCCKK